MSSQSLNPSLRPIQPSLQPAARHSSTGPSILLGHRPRCELVYPEATALVAAAPWPGSLPSMLGALWGGPDGRARHLCRLSWFGFGFGFKFAAPGAVV